MLMGKGRLKISKKVRVKTDLILVEERLASNRRQASRKSQRISSVST